MNEPSKQDFGRNALAVAVAAALVPTVAQGAAGRVDFAYGDVKSVKPSGLQQRLRKGSQIEQGDTIVTARGRAQIRFSDGARTSLLPNSEFRVDAYEYEEEAEEEATGFFSLLKGGLRTITGAIGKLRRDAYQLTTPSATIGIRGTEYLVVLGNSASIWVGDGEIEACNDGGCQSFIDGESGYVADRSTRPIRTTTKPDTSAADLGTEQSLIVGDVVDDDGQPLGITDGSISETGYTVAISVGDGTGEGHLGSTIEQDSDLQVTLDAGNGLLQLLDYGTGNGELTGTRGTATVLDVGNSAGNEVVWGRWTTGIITTDTYAPPIPVPVTLTGSESHHYAAGIPPADMPGEGVTASYNLIGGTAPTYADGSGVGTLDAASLNVDFGSHLVAVEVIFTIGGNEFFIDSPFTPLGSGGESHAFFAYGNLTTGPGCGPDGCSTDLEGFFAGPGASHAGLVYLVFDNSADSHVNGAVGFEQAGSGEPINPTDPSNPLRDGQLYVLSVAVEDEIFSLGSTASIPDSLVDGTFDDNKLTSFGVGSGGEFVTTTLVNGEQVLDAGRDDTASLFLGRWTNGTVEITYPPASGYPPESEALGPVSLHYAGGLPTVNMPMGTGSYQLISGTTPTYADGSGSGTLDSGSLNVDFDTSLVSVDLAFTINDNQFFIDSPFTPIGTGPYAHTFSTSGPLTTGDACLYGPCYTYIEGFFAGEGASRAGLTYMVGDDSTERYVNGAAGFASVGAGTPITPPITADGTVAISVGDGTGVGNLGSAIEQGGSPNFPLQVTLDSANGLLQLLDYGGTGNDELTGTRGTATVLDVGNSSGDEVLWGRWTTGIITTDTFNPPVPVDVTLTGSESHHYAAGIPTADMPGAGVTASYNLIGGTAPTYADGSGVGTLDAASLNVDFGTRLVDVDVIFTIGGNEFFINSPFTPLGSGDESHAFFAADYLTNGVGCDPGGCFTELEGFFAGPGASHAGLVYLVFGNSADSDVNGAAGFVSAGPGTPITPPITADGTVAISVGDGTGVGNLGSAIDQGGSPNVPLQVTLDSANGLLLLLDYGGTGNDELTGTRGTATVLDVGNSSGGEVLWGRWTTGIITTDTFFNPPVPADVTLTGSESHHYAAGIPTADMPGAGVTASYNLIGGTAPTYADGSGVGTLDAASLNVDFGTRLVAVDVIFTIGGNEFFINSPFTPLGSGDESHAFFAADYLTNGVGCDPGGCFTELEGFFAGPGASHAGLVYLVFGNSADSDVNGAAGFVSAGPGTPITPPIPPITSAGTVAISVGDGTGVGALGSAIDQGGSPNVPLQVTLDSANGLLLLLDYGGTGNDELTGTRGTATVLDVGNSSGGEVLWGRWTTGIITTDTFFNPPVPADVTLTGSESHHYAAGIPTADMPGAGVTASYNLIGGTAPTYADGSGTGTLDAASLNVDFGTRLVAVDVTFTIGGNQFFIDSPFTPLGSVDESHAFFAADYLTNGVGCDPGGCFTELEGFFAGPGASHAGLVYLVFGNSADSDVNGAAGFVSAGAGTPIPVFEDTVGVDPVAPVYALAVALGNSVAGSGSSNDINAAFANGVGLRSYNGVLNGDIGDARLVEESTDGVVGWGRWTDGTITTDISDPPNPTLFSSESQHYAIGLPTADMPMTGTASYDMIGGTSPTYASAPGAIGQLNSASLNVDFGTSKVNAAIDFSIGGNTFNVDTAPDVAGSINGANFSYSGFGTTGAACSTGCSTTIEGFFAGAGASRAGLAYSVRDDQSNNINGAVGLASNGIGSGTAIPAP